MRKTKNIKHVFPRIFCLEDIQCLPSDTGGFSCRATLYHDQACITVSFNCPEHDPALKNGEFVSVRWLPAMHSNHGAIQVAGLTVLNSLTKDFNPKKFNPFLTVPHSWSVDRHLINCARDLWGISSKEMQRLLFATVLAQTGYSERH